MRCTDPDCPHDLLGNCPKELADAVIEGQRRNRERREKLLQLVRRANDENKPIALSILCARLISTATGEQLESLIHFIEADGEPLQI